MPPPTTNSTTSPAQARRKGLSSSQKIKTAGRGTLTSTVQGIADDGALLFHDGQNLYRLIQADEVRLL